MPKVTSAVANTDTMSGKFAEFIEASAAARGKNYGVMLTKDPGRPRGDGQQFRRFRRAHHGVVSSRMVSPRHHVFG